MADSERQEWTEVRNVRVLPNGTRFPWRTHRSHEAAEQERSELLFIVGIPLAEVQVEERTVTATEWRPRPASPTQEREA